MTRLENSTTPPAAPASPAPPAPGPASKPRGRAMEGSRVQQVALDRALSFPAATLEWPFGPEWDVVKVVGKVFLLMAELRGEPIVILKADPVDARLLCQELAEVTPGYHMNKRHWITLAGGPGLDEELVEDLVTDSYRLVVAGLPRALRPVDPERFGRRDAMG